MHILFSNLYRIQKTPVCEWVDFICNFYRTKELSGSGDIYVDLIMLRHNGYNDELSVGLNRIYLQPLFNCTANNADTIKFIPFSLRLNLSSPQTMATSFPIKAAIVAVLAGIETIQIGDNA